MPICYDDSNNLIAELLDACSLHELKNAVYNVFIDQLGCCATTWDNVTSVDPVADPAQANIESGFDMIDCTTPECPISFLIDTGVTNNGGVPTMYWSDDCGGTWNDTSGGVVTTFPPLLQTYSFTGSDQILTIPAGYTSMEMYAWGAGGTRRSGGIRFGGAGGFAFGTLAVAAGDQFAIMVGERGYNVQVFPAQDGVSSYGFGGINNVGGQAATSGAGLSGVFSGAGAILSTDSARALVVAGGGGGNGTASGNNPLGNGGNGGSPSSGGQPDFFGQTGVSDDAAGGGGFTGGVAGNNGAGIGSRGGSSFVSGLLTNAGTQFSPDFTLSNLGNSPTYYIAGGSDHPYFGSQVSHGTRNSEGLNGHVVIRLT